jgi:peptide/nickel transport system permease protein
LVNVLDADYVRTARSNGLLERSVILKHALKNGAISVVTVIGIQASFLLGGSVIIERVFGIPGIGSLAIIAVLQRDLTVVQGVVLSTATIVLVINMTVDLTYGLLNPKARA